MQIQNNLPSMNASRNQSISERKIRKSLEKLSSGFRIVRAGDDAAGLAISELMRSRINGLNQAAKNADDAIGLIQTAEGALTETHSMLQRMKTLTTQSANGTYTSDARDNIQAEMNQLAKEITRIAETTEFSGVKPLSSTVTTMSFQIGVDASLVGGVNVNRLEIESKKMDADSLDLMKDKDNAIEVNTVDKALDALDTIEKAITSVSSYRAELGAAQNRLEHTVNNLNVTSENITAAESRIRDTDMADEMTAFTKNNILAQAAQSMLAQANAQPQGILSLLQ